jgi:cyclophilin family peptidyl-prolyl cis-trans isomerase
VGTTKRERQKANRQQRLEQMAKSARKQQSRRKTFTWVGVGVAAIVAIYLIVFLTGGDDDSVSPSNDPVATAPITTEPADDPDTSDPGTSDPATSDPSSSGFAYGTGECAPEEKPSEPVRSFTDAPQQCIDAAATYSALVETNKGNFTIELDTVNSPGTANNFVNLARWGYYDQSTCHRVISGFVVQCGRPDDDESAPGYTIPDEPVVTEYAEGVVAMANTGQPNSGGGQWFVITGANGAALPPQYTVLGTVTDGYDVVKELEALADPAASNGVPTLEPITITSVTVTQS